jgi:hypothetical protein
LLENWREKEKKEKRRWQVGEYNGIFWLIVVVILGVAGLVFEIERIYRGLQKEKEEKKKLIKEIIQAKKRLSGVPEKIRCTSCGRFFSPKALAVASFFDEKGRLKSVQVLCPKCLNEAFPPPLKTDPAKNYAGRIEKFFKECVCPYPWADGVEKEVVRVQKELLGEKC